MCSNPEELGLFLTYEVKQSMRHRRYLSLAMLHLNGTGPKLGSLLRRGVRESDWTFFSHDTAVVLMGQTHKTDAIKAVNRYRNDFGDRFDIRASVSTFPDDGRCSKDLINVLEQRLKKAMELGFDAMVAE